MKNVRSALCFVLITIFAVALISCEQPKAQDNGYAVMEMTVDVPVEEKLLTVWAPGQVRSFVYKATPKFVQDGDVYNDIVGQRLDWAPVTFYTSTGEEETVGHLRASMGYYQPGGWEIEIMALNAGGNPVYYGTTGHVYLNAGERNGFVLELHGVQSIGSAASLDVTFSGPRVSEALGGSPKPVMDIKWLDGTTRRVGSGWTSTIQTDGTILHHIHIDNLPAGETDVVFSTVMPDGTIVTKETAAVLLINGETTTVEGTLETGSYIDPGFDIEEDKSEITASIRIVSGGSERVHNPYDGGERFFDVAIGSAAVFSYDLTGAEGDSWRWLVDGVQKGTGKTFTFTENDPGQYQITAMTWRDEKTCSEEILVVVK